MAKIYVETNKYNADIKVYEVNSKYDAGEDDSCGC